MSEPYGFLELKPVEMVDSGWIHAYGVYYPRHQAIEHLNSDWSRAVILAKRRMAGIIDRFGSIVAGRMERWLRNDVPYVVTHVPAEPEPVQYLFADMGRGAPELLAESIHRHLGARHNIQLDTLIMQLRPKARKQRQCEGMAEREANVRGLYTVPERVVIGGDHVILVDDVLTSGATMRECSRILREAGALSVTGVALARTVRIQDGDTRLEEKETYENTMPAAAMVADRLAG
jgi:predicted kinase